MDRAQKVGSAASSPRPQIAPGGDHSAKTEQARSCHRLEHEFGRIGVRIVVQREALRGTMRSFLGREMDGLSRKGRARGHLERNL